MSMNAPAGSYARRPGVGSGVSSPNKLFGLAFGAVYVLVGLVGFLVTGGVPFAATQGKTLILFALNPLHNIVHILVGALFLAGASRGEAGAARINTLIGAVYLLVGVAGLFVIGTANNLLALNQADNGLHFATAVLALGIGVYGLSRSRATA